MFMHEKLQGLEEMTEDLKKTLDIQERKRMVDNASLKVRLSAIEDSMAAMQSSLNANPTRTPVQPQPQAKKRSAVAVKSDNDASSSDAAVVGSSSNRPEDLPLFPLESNQAMERLAEESATNESLREYLREMLRFGRYNPEVTIRTCISDKVLSGYSTRINTSKPCISESRFICMIQGEFGIGTAVFYG